MKDDAAIKRRIERIKRELAQLGDMRPGSLSVQTRSWGGEYHQLSYTHQGRGRTEYVSTDNKKQVEQQIANYRKFRDLTKEWVDLGIQLCKIKTKRTEQK